jgi:hypothetical protein
VSFSFLSTGVKTPVLKEVGDLSIPKEELFDKSYVNLCNIRQSLLEEELEKVHYATSPFSEEEVQNSIFHDLLV